MSSEGGQRNLPGGFANAFEGRKQAKSVSLEEIAYSFYPIMVLKSIQIGLKFIDFIAKLVGIYLQRLLRMKSTQRMIRIINFVAQHLGLLGLVLFVYTLIRVYRIGRRKSISKSKSSIALKSKRTTDKAAHTSDSIDTNFKVVHNREGDNGVAQIASDNASKADTQYPTEIEAIDGSKSVDYITHTTFTQTNLTRQDEIIEDCKSDLPDPKQNFVGNATTDGIQISDNTLDTINSFLKEIDSTLNTSRFSDTSLEIINAESDKTMANHLTITTKNSILWPVGSNASLDNGNVSVGSQRIDGFVTKNPFSSSRPGKILQSLDNDSNLGRTSMNDGELTDLHRRTSISTLESSTFSTDLESDDDFLCLSKLAPEFHSDFDFGTFDLPQLDNVGVNGDITQREPSIPILDNNYRTLSHQSSESSGMALTSAYVSRSKVTPRRKLVKSSTNSSEMNLKDVPRDSGVEIRDENRVPSSIAYHSNQDLTSVPQVDAYTRQLLLNDNKISTIHPVAFSNLHSLTLLNLCGNTLQVLPEEITQLVTLEFLYLRKNSLKEVVQVSHNSYQGDLKIFATSKFATLLKILYQNYVYPAINVDPSCFVNCSKLQILDLSYNLLQELPSSIGRLKSLRTLLVQENSFPSSLYNLVEPLTTSYQIIMSGKTRSENRHPGHGYLLRLQGHLADVYDLETYKAPLPPRHRSDTSLSFGDIQIPVAEQNEKVRNIIAELVETEKTYCYELQIVKQLYQIPMTNSNVFNEFELSIIFSNIDDIRKLHSELVLPNLMDIEKGGKSVGLFFSALCPLLTRYVEYLNNFDWSNTALNQFETPSGKKYLSGSILSWFSFSEDRRARFANIKTQAKFSPLHTQLNLSSYLVLPVQRLPRYKLFMDALVKATPARNPDYQNLVDAQKALISLVTYCNESKRKWETQLIDLLPLFEISIPREPYSKLLLSWPAGRVYLGRFEDLRIVKYVELAKNNYSKSLAPFILCNGKKHQYTTKRQSPLEECKFKVSKSLNPTRYAKAIERNGNISKFDVAFTAGKSCTIILCSDVMAITNSQKLLAGCLKLPLTAAAAFVPITTIVDTADPQEAVARLTDGQCIIYLKGPIDSISNLVSTLNSN